MTNRLFARLILGVALALLAASCGDDALDPVVIIDMESTEAQPWTATGELVEAGLICPSGDRENLYLTYPDGSPMPLDEMISLFEEAWAAGGSPEDVARIGTEEYVCNDGSGTFTMTEIVTGDPSDPMTGQVIRGSGAYVMMTGTCSTEVTETEDRTDIIDLTTTCEFDVGSDPE